MSTYEVRPFSSPMDDPDATQVEWRDPSVESVVLRSELDPWLREFGQVPDRAIDLVRLAMGAFVADQLEGRGAGFSRTIELRAHLLEPAAWSEGMLGRFADLLSSLSGDRWIIGVGGDATETRPLVQAEDLPSEAGRVALLSGGLDSFSGAVLSSAQDDPTIYLGHWNQPQVKNAQNAIAKWFAEAGRPIEYRQVRIGVASDKVEQTTRTRALLFMALGVALASARGANRLDVPENGLTSINLPLGQDRGGALTTRSTHPRTFADFNELLAALEVPVVVSNPHATQTKGEVVSAAAAASPGDFAPAATATYSCAKPPTWFKGANPNDHCGVCVACITRRAAFLSAGVADRTKYVYDYLAGPGRTKFELQRLRDVDAVKRTILVGFDETDLLMVGPFPDDFDPEAALDLCQRGLAELSLVRV
jgi:7-cyano-7-deazaguanine synthase in queuosine biosynthesis